MIIKTYEDVYKRQSWFRITVGSVQTLMRQSRLERFSQDYFNTIIIDEGI